MPKDSSFFPPVSKYFKQNKWSVHFYDYRKGSLAVRALRFTPIIGGFEKALQKIFDDILKIAEELKPDLILTIKGENLTSEFLKKLKTENPKTILVNWFPDPINQWDLMKKISSYNDFYFDSDHKTVGKLKKIGRRNAYYLPFAATIEKDIMKNKKFDLSFVGTYSPFREKYLSALSKFDLNIWGDPRWNTSSLKNFFRGGRIHQRKMKDIIKKSRININIHHNTPREGTNLRTFEITGSGGFLLAEYVKDLAKLFEIGKEIETFKNPREMTKKVQFFLSNPDLVQKIARAGYKKAKKIHSYEKRLPEMLKVVYSQT